MLYIIFLKQIHQINNYTNSYNVPKIRFTVAQRGVCLVFFQAIKLYPLRSLRLRVKPDSLFF